MGEKAYTDSFAKIYDQIMDGVPYDLWYNYLKELLDYYNKKPERVLDLACGTGNMSLRFARKGYSVVGLDRSKAMLEIARAKTSSLEMSPEFIQADIRDFCISNRFDFVFSLFDSLNYILSIIELKKVFSNVYKVLNSRGIFIFDMNTPTRLMSIKPGTTLLNGEGYTCFWEDMVDEKLKRWQVKLKIYFDENNSFAYEEFHEETAYPSQEVIDALYETGFKEVDVYNAYTFNQGHDKHNRLYYVALKNKPIKNKKNLFGKKLKWKLVKYF